MYYFIGCILLFIIIGYVAFKRDVKLQKKRIIQKQFIKEQLSLKYPIIFDNKNYELPDNELHGLKFKPTNEFFQIRNLPRGFKLLLEDDLEVEVVQQTLFVIKNELNKIHKNNEKVLALKTYKNYENNTKVKFGL